MSSEKMKYCKDHPARDAFEYSKLKELLLTRLQQLTGSELARLLQITTHKEMMGNYQLIAQLVPMDGQHAEILLAALIEQEKTRDGLITEDCETIVRQLTGVLYGEVEKLCNKQFYIESATIVFSILVIIEQEMQYVYDEGFTFQCIVEDGFKLLAKIASQDYGQDIGLALIASATAYNKRRPSQMMLYDDEWADAAEAFRKEG